MKSIFYFKSARDKSRIFNYLIPFYLDGFYNNEITGAVLALRDIDCNEWFNDFKKTINESKRGSFLPICRLSDGEYSFICGPQPPIKNNLLSQFISRFIFFTKQFFSNGGMNAETSRGISSGIYNKFEIEKSRIKYLNSLREISLNGILALHLTYAKKPFQERYHYKLSSIFQKNNIEITRHNYFPFYFVYAYFLTHDFVNYINGKNVLIITGASEGKADKVTNYFTGIGAGSVHFYKISENRSLFDTINVDILLPLDIDICFVAAGIGKPNILIQLKQLCCPCIDVGFMFEVWANPKLAYSRPFCSTNYN